MTVVSGSELRRVDRKLDEKTLEISISLEVANIILAVD